MGEVWLVYDRKLSCTYAAKKINAELIRDKDVSRFTREIQNLERARHPNIVRIIDSFEDAGMPCFAMEYCSKGSIETLISKTKNDADNVWNILKQLLDGLKYLHELDPPIIHRDIKPSNILLGDDGNIKLSDFGLSKSINQDTVTTSNWISEGFSAPEQYLDMAQSNERSDIYSCGAVAHYFITGQLADFRRSPARASYHNHKFDQILPRMLRYDPSQRPRTVAEILLASDKLFFTTNSTGEYGSAGEIEDCSNCGGWAISRYDWEPAGTFGEIDCLTCGHSEKIDMEKK
jgi:serine/threonine-protein kinase